MIRKMNLTWLPCALFVLILQPACKIKQVVYKPSSNFDPQPELEKINQAVTAAADPLKNEQWYIDHLGVEDGKNTGSANLKIALLSSGVDYLHEDLQKNLAFNIREMEAVAAGDASFVNAKDEDGNGLVDDIIGFDVIDEDGYPFDRHGAGTAVAGIIGATNNNGLGISGLLQKVAIYPIRYIDDSGQTNVSLLQRALQVALQTSPDVIFVQTVDIKKVEAFEIGFLKEVLSKLAAKDIPIVVPAGNGNTMLGNESLQALFATYPNVFLVTSHNKEGKKPLLANYHPNLVILSAPGTKILTTWLDSTYKEVSSTAYAAGMLTAAIGQAKAELGDITTQSIKVALGLPEGGSHLDGFEHYTMSGNGLNMKKFLSLLGQ